MASRRTKSISTKVTAEEYAQLEARAGQQTISEWVRSVLLQATTPTAFQTIVLAEVLANRVISLNMLFAALRGELLTPEAVQQVIDRADADKLQLAHERLTAADTERSS